MATVQDLIDATEDELTRNIKSTSLATYTEDYAFRLIKDCYNEIHRILYLPLKSATFGMTASSQVVDLATVASDIYNGNDGIRQLTYLDTVVTRKWRDPWMTLWGRDYLNPPGLYPAMHWLELDSHQKFVVVPWGMNSASTDFKIIYTQELAKPTLTANTLHADIVPYIHIIPQYMAGRLLRKGKDPRAASYLAEFQGRLADVKKRNKQQGRRNAGEAYSGPLADYYRNNFGTRTYRR